MVRRSAHKSVESMLKKIEEDREDGRIGEWFSRFNVEVTEADVERFRQECLDPILETMLDWYDHITGTSSKRSPFDCAPGGSDRMVHWTHPRGVYNILDENGTSDLDAMLESGSTAGLRQTSVLYPELA